MSDEVLNQVAVLGAAGKMGRGISLLLLQEIVIKEKGALVLIDSSGQALNGLRHYLLENIKRFAERNINRLRQDFVDHSLLISNEEIIDAFVEKALDLIRFETEVTAAKDSSFVFEAIIEDSRIKAEVFSQIDSASKIKPYYLSNTSSIPIHELMEKSGIEGRLIGFHFYNPPPVQKLVELIPAKATARELLQHAKTIAQRLDKVVVISQDVAGFIGNGHFMREIDYACKKVQELEKKWGRKEAFWIVNQMTEELLIRPMGIFQLVDYVGLDVCQKVLEIMNRQSGEVFDLSLLKSLIRAGLKGGQNADGSQKPGIFQYEKHTIQKIWNGGKYEELPRELLGALPDGHVAWKYLHKDKNKDEILSVYFKNLFASNAFSAQLAQEYLKNSRDIARNLIASGVAKNNEDVDTVLKCGFYHLYGPDNVWIH